MLSYTDEQLETLINARHAFEIGFCTQGSRDYLKGLGVDYRRFVTVGIPAKELLALDDAFCNRLIAHVFREEKWENPQINRSQ